MPLVSGFHAEKNLSTLKDLGAPRCCFYGWWIIILLFLISLLKVFKKKMHNIAKAVSHNNQIEMLILIARLCT